MAGPFVCTPRFFRKYFLRKFICKTMHVLNKNCVIEVKKIAEQTFLNDLYSFIVKLSQRIKLRSSNGGGSMPGRQEDTEFFHKTFPFFIWLLRDVTQSIPPDCKDIKEYFLTRVRYNFSLHHTKFAWCCFGVAAFVVDVVVFVARHPQNRQ